MTLHKLQNTVHFRMLELRSLIRLLGQESFIKIYEIATSEQQAELVKIVESCDRDAAEKWYNNIIEKSALIEEFPMKELRAICSTFNIKNWRFMTRQMLISAIREKENGKARISTSDLQTAQGNASACS